MKKYANSRFSGLFLLCAASLSLLFTGCLSSRIKKSIEKGDDLYALELITAELSENPENADMAEYLAQVYPSAAEKRIPSKSVDILIEENLSSYGSTRAEALKAMAVSTGGVEKTVQQAEDVLKKLKELALIQKYVSPLPETVGNPKKGKVAEVKKYEEDFANLYEEGVHSIASWYFDLADALDRDTSADISVMEKTYSYYAKASGLEENIFNSNNLAAGKAYEIGTEYEKLSGIASRKTALKWFKACYDRNSTYRDVQNKVHEINYLIALELAPYAKSPEALEEVVSYLDSSGDYRDSQVLLTEYKYQLAKTYRAQETVSSYKKAGKLFQELENYKDSAYEAELYGFYTKLDDLKEKDYSRGVSLNTRYSRKNDFDHHLDGMETEYANLFSSVTTSTLNVYTRLLDSDLYPGMLIEGSSVAEQSFREFPYGSRKAYKVDVKARSRQLSGLEVTDPSEKDCSTMIKNEVYKAGWSLSPDTEFEATEVFNADDLSIALGLGYGKNGTGSLYGFFDGRESVVVLKVKQVYFSAEVEEPSLPVDFFAADSGAVTEAALTDITPYYVSSVNYGRAAYFIITSRLPGVEIMNDLETLRPSRNSFSYGRSFQGSVIHKWNMNGTRISCITVGENSGFMSGIEGISSWIYAGYNNLGRKVKDFCPVSFELKSLQSNDYAVLSSSESARIRNPYWRPEEDKGDGSVPGGGKPEQEGGPGEGNGGMPPVPEFPEH